MAVTITAEERDALYDEILTRLGGIDTVHKAAVNREYVTAAERAREFTDHLLLVLNDLGWGDTKASSESIELTTPPDVVRRSMSRLLCSAADQLGLDEDRQAAEKAEMSGMKFLAATCAGVINALDDESQ